MACRPSPRSYRLRCPGTWRSPKAKDGRTEARSDTRDVLDRNSFAIVLLLFLWLAEFDEIRAPAGGGADAVALHREARGRIRLDRLQNLDERYWDGPQHCPGTIAGPSVVVGSLEEGPSFKRLFSSACGSVQSSLGRP